MRYISSSIAKLTLLTFMRLTLDTGVPVKASSAESPSAPSTAQAAEAQRSPAPKATPTTQTADQTASSCPKFLVVDAIEPATGVQISLDADLTRDGKLPERRDAQLTGNLRLPSGDVTPILVAIPSKYAHAIRLVRTSDGSDAYKIMAEGIPEATSSAFEITLTERQVPGTDVTRVEGQLYDPATKRRLNFTITHDPVPIVVVIGVVAAAAVVICGAIVLADKWKNDCTSKAREQCGENRVKEVTAVRTYGFAWDKSGPRVGCGEDCKIVCINK